MATIKEVIREEINEVLKDSYPEESEFKYTLEETDPKYGDYSSNVALVLAREKGETPLDLAGKIAEKLEGQEIFQSVEAVKPGFINFKIALPYLQQKILEIVSAEGKYGDSDLGKDLKVNIEFISANPTGPLTLGNGRGGYAGDCLARVFKSFGATVEREYYVNDRGAQVRALGHSVLKDEESVYKGEYIDEIAPKIKTKDPQEAGSQAVSIIIEEYIKKTVLRMGINFDRWFLETNLHKGRVEEILGKLQKGGLTFSQDGALWLKTTDYGDDKDRVLITKEGEYTYIASDIAYHWDKIRRDYNLLIDYWGADHHGYIGRLQAAIEILKKEEDWSGEIIIQIAQLVRLMSGGKEVRMSKRKGNFVTLDELIDDVGTDVTRFFFLERSLDTHMDFDLDLAKEKSQKNPVYYIQYAYARISSILNKVENFEKPDVGLIKEEKETDLLKELIKLPDLVLEIAENYQTQRLPQYALSLATKFHHFYEQCRVISEDKDLTNARLELIKASRIVLKKTLDLMGISSPEKM